MHYEHEVIETRGRGARADSQISQPLIEKVKRFADIFLNHRLILNAEDQLFSTRDPDHMP